MISFFVPGNPKPKGSFKAFKPRNSRFPIVTNDCSKTKPWQSLISIVAIQEIKDMELIMGPIEIELDFILKRPKSLPKRVLHHTKKPDIDKLTRCVLDALKGIIYMDDSQVIMVSAGKRYLDGKNLCEKTGVLIKIKNI